MVEHYPGTTPPVDTGSSMQGGGGQQFTEQAKQQSRQLAQQARQQASDLAHRGTEQAKGQLANQKHEVSQRLVPMQTALRETAQQLRRQGRWATTPTRPQIRSSDSPPTCVRRTWTRSPKR